METEKGLSAKVGGTRGRIPSLILIIIGPLIGLGYIIVVPIFYVAAFILACSYHAVRRLVRGWAKAGNQFSPLGINRGAHH